MATTVFDPVAYKETTRQQWQKAAAAWHRWGPALEEWLGEATELMLDLARIGEGSRVLDVAAGAGGQALAAARSVGPTGAVLATDISSNILEFAERQARDRRQHRSDHAIASRVERPEREHHEIGAVVGCPPSAEAAREFHQQQPALAAG